MRPICSSMVSVKPRFLSCAGASDGRSEADASVGCVSALRCGGGAEGRRAGGSAVRVCETHHGRLENLGDAVAEDFALELAARAKARVESVSARRACVRAARRRRRGSPARRRPNKP